MSKNILSYAKSYFKVFDVLFNPHPDCKENWVEFHRVESCEWVKSFNLSEQQES